MEFTASRRICVLPEDRVGNGDSIGVLCGLGMPAILRSLGYYKYQFVGVCYRDGM